MVKWLVAAGVLVAAIVFLLFQVGDSSPTSTSNVSPDLEAQRRGQVAIAPPVAPAPSTETPRAGADDTQAIPDKPGVLSPESDEFSRRLDSAIPRRLTAGAATRCDVTGLDPDAKARIEYRLQIVGGEVLATGVRIADSTLGDPALEQCIIAAIEQTRWREDDLPDWNEEQDFLFRVRALKKYLSPEEQGAFGRDPNAPPADESDD